MRAEANLDPEKRFWQSGRTDPCSCAAQEVCHPKIAPGAGDLWISSRNLIPGLEETPETYVQLSDSYPQPECWIQVLPRARI